MNERPNGSQATLFGFALIVIGVLALLVGGGAETFEGMIWSAVIANLGIGLGIVLLSLGYLVRAIWFLPGREIEADAPTSTEIKQSGVFCDWCHLWVEAPDKPCSRSDEEAIRVDVAAASKGEGLANACRLELIKKGIIEE